MQHLMQQSLNMDNLPQYIMSSFRYFEKGERHVTRVWREDVLVIVFDGVLRFYEEGIPVEVSKGQYYIQQKGLFQEGKEESDMPQYYYVHFNGSFDSTGNHLLPICGEANLKELYPLFQKLEFLQRTDAGKLQLTGVFYQILSVLSKGFSRSEGQKVVEKAISFVLREPMQPYSLDDLAKVCGYSKNHIINIFKQETGQTPCAYISEIKIKMAKNLLINSQLSLAQIGASCGFGNYINFYKEFVKQMGCPPKEWRKQQQ